MITKSKLKVVKLLLWKSWKVRLHYKLWSIALFVLPLIYPASLVAYFKYTGAYWSEIFSTNGSYSPPIYSLPHELFNESFKSYYDLYCYNDECRTYKLFYTPNNEYTTKVMQTVKQMFDDHASLGMNRTFHLKSVNTDSEMRRMIENGDSDTYSEKIIGGISFRNIGTDNGGVPSKIHYDVIVNGFSVSQSLYTAGPEYYFWSSNEIHVHSYISRKFIALQAAVDIAHLKLLTDETLNVNVFLQPMPLPGPNKSYTYYDMNTILIEISFTIALLFMFPVTVKRIVEEKSTRIKEYVNSCGVNSGLYWTTTNVDTFCLVSLQILAVYIIYSISINVSVYYSATVHTQYLSISIMDAMNTSGFLLFIIFLVFFIQTTLFASFLTIFFGNPNVAAAASIVISVVTAIYPTLSMFYHFNTYSYSSIFPNCSIFWIFYVLRGRHYLNEEANTFSNLFDNSRWGDSLSVGEVLFFMIISSTVYAILTWYLSEVSPWQNGISKPWYFPFAAFYNRYVSRKRSSHPSQNNTPLVIENVTKRYKSTRLPVLKNVSFDVQENSLTVLLGPNGSGKSTLINIICGLIQQSKGKVAINGYSVNEDIETAQSFLGFCPQHNTFFEHLTIYENLQLICALKCELRERVEGYKVDEIIEMLSLQPFAYQMTRNLSSGVLRRLTLGMAMVGPCDILVTDEPTESLDPMAKRSVWDLLVKWRQSKTVLVCSHQLDEVNVIADKVAVLINGELKCVKTTLELKKEYGMGYSLRIKKKPEFITNETIHSIVAENAKSVTAEQYNNESEELVFHVSFEERHAMPSILNDLTRNQFTLGVESMSLFATTLEEVYLKLIANEDNKNVQKISMDDSMAKEDTNFHKETEESKWKLYIGQFQALILKNVYFNIRHWSLFLIFIVIPMSLILLTVLAITIVVNRHVVNLTDGVVLSQKLYGSHTRSFVDTSDDSFTNAYRSISNNVLVFNDDKSISLQNWILTFATRDVVDYFQNFLFGASFTRVDDHSMNITVWFSQPAVHSLPIALNTAMNSLLRIITKNSDYSIEVENRGFSQEANFNREIAYSDADDYTAAFPLCIALYALCYSAYIIRPVNERSVGFIHLQLMTGLRPIIYWLSQFIYDLTFNFLCSSTHILCLYLIDSDGIYTKSPGYFSSNFAVFFFAGLSQIPFMYTFSFAFKKSSSAYIFMCISCVLLGLPFYPFATRTTRIHNSFSTILLILFPFATFPFTLTSLYNAFVKRTVCDRLTQTKYISFCDTYSTLLTNDHCCPNLCPKNTSIWNYMQQCHMSPSPLYEETDGFTILLLFGLMAISGILYFSVTLILEYNALNGFLSRLFSATKRSMGVNLQYLSSEKCMSEDVVEEANYVSEVVKSNRASHESMVIQELTKEFGTLRIPNRINLTVRKGECLGILGGNSCGKTTTFKLLTSQLKNDFGNAFINDLNTSLTKNTPKYLSLIGYCPQTDSLLDCLTGHETLKLFMKLRGITSFREIDTIASMFHLKSVIKQRVSTYSGGNRRKLSLAIALIGNQKLLLLDEPTNGVDPCSRSKIWQLLRNISETFQVSILLTSHNMQEVETLCDRIAVMHNGKIKCIGSLQELREKFGKGFNLIAKVERMEAEDDHKLMRVKKLIEEAFTGAEVSLKYENFGYLYYNLVSNSISLCSIFEKLEEIKTLCKLEDYIVSNANLEQNLLLFMKKD